MTMHDRRRAFPYQGQSTHQYAAVAASALLHDEQVVPHTSKSLACERSKVIELQAINLNLHSYTDTKDKLSHDARSSRRWYLHIGLASLANHDCWRVAFQV